MKITCIIIDDEYLAIRILKNFAAQTGKLEVSFTFTSAEPAMEWLSSNNVDLIFSDILMPGINGIEFVKKLVKKPAIIYTTARQDFAIQAYELDVIDYLVKPVAFERFEKAVNKCIMFIEYNKMNTLKKQQTGYLLLKADYKVMQIPHNEILLIEGLSEYVKIHTTEKKHIVLSALKNLIEELPPDDFVRIHKSFIVNKKYIHSYNSSSLHTIDKKELPIGRTYKTAFMLFMKKH